VENIYTAYHFSHFAIYLPKVIKVGGNLTKFWQKQKCTVFWATVYIDFWRWTLIQGCVIG